MTTCLGHVIAWSVRQRRLDLGATIALTVAGVWALLRTPVDAIPDLSDVQVIVMTEWPGQAPELVEDQITYPLSIELLKVPHTKVVRGMSQFGVSAVYVVFEDGTDLYWARSRVLEELSAIRARLPDSVNPVLGPAASGVGWSFQYTLVDQSGRRGLDELRAFQDFTLRYAIGQVPGVAEVASVGGYERQYQVTIDPSRLRTFGVTLDEVVRKVRDSSGEVGGRVIESSDREYYVRGRGYVQNLAALERTG